MSRTERMDYDRHMDDIMVENDVLDTAKMEGRAEGRAEGIKDTALKLKEMGLSTEQIMVATGLSKSEIDNL